MIETPVLIDTPATPTAVIHLTIPKADIGAAMGPALRELMSAIAAQGVAPAGPWFAHHFKIAPDMWDFEVSVPVAGPVAAVGRVAPGLWPAMRMVRTVYQGPYQGLGDGWGEFRAWIAAQGHNVGDELWERYLSGPESGQDPALWRTELSKQIVG